MTYASIALQSIMSRCELKNITVEALCSSLFNVYEHGTVFKQVTSKFDDEKCKYVCIYTDNKMKILLCKKNNISTSVESNMLSVLCYKTRIWGTWQVKWYNR